ncbi:MAG: murein transglycosylase [Geminicoccaceae bacterium]|nr:murein transglycosylase [Geminicoccaceae bacterium]
MIRPRAGRLRLLTPLAVAALALAGCAAPTPPAPPAPELGLRPVAFERLAGWSEDDPRAALAAFRRSCEKLRSAGKGPMGPEPAFGSVDDWLTVCAAADQPASAASAPSARQFFETWFQPYQVTDRGASEGLFTGYYEPVLNGSRRPGPLYPVPLHAPPPDLLRIDLGRFNPDLAGYAIHGRVEGRDFVPYHSRAEIEGGALAGRELELLWVDDPIAKFFLQIQGSGQVRLDDGAVVRVGYATQNGHPYRAIGRDLIEIGALTRDEVSLQTIRDWLQAHPKDAAAIMARNRSYIFFQEHPELAAADGPLGAQGVPLTAGRSLAVDRRYIPLGVPLWLETSVQDTGGAIKGAVRGDVFWGGGERAEAIAGRMKGRGQYAVLLPRALVPTS